MSEFAFRRRDSEIDSYLHDIQGVALLSPYLFGQLQRPGLASMVAWIRVVFALCLSLALVPVFAELGVAAALAIADVCSTLLILTLYVRIAATPVAQAVLPRTSDFGGVLRRVQP